MEIDGIQSRGNRKRNGKGRHTRRNRRSAHTSDNSHLNDLPDDSTPETHQNELDSTDPDADLIKMSWEPRRTPPIDAESLNHNEEMGDSKIPDMCDDSELEKAKQLLHQSEENQSVQSKEASTTEIEKEILVHITTVTDIPIPINLPTSESIFTPAYTIDPIIGYQDEHSLDHEEKTNNKADMEYSNVDISAPRVGVPSVKADVEMPAAASVDVEGKVAAPDLSVDVSAPSVEMPSVTADLEVPSTDLAVDVSVPSVELPSVKAGVDVPEGAELALDGDVGKPAVSLDVSGAEVAVPEADVKVKGPKFGLKLGKLKMKGKEKEAKPADVSAGAEVEVDAKAGGKKRAGWKLGWPKGSLKLGAPEHKADVKVDVPGVPAVGAEAEAHISAPDVQLELPTVDAGAEVAAGAGELDVGGEVRPGSAEVSVPSKKFRFGFGSGRKPSGKTKRPKKAKGAVDLDVGVDVPEAEVSVAKEKPSGGWKFPLFGSFSSPKVKVDKPEVDVNVSAPSVEVPSVKADVEVPAAASVDVEGKVAAPDLYMVDLSTKSDLRFSASPIECDSVKSDLQLPSGEFPLPSKSVRGSSNWFPFACGSLRKSANTVEAAVEPSPIPSIDSIVAGSGRVESPENMNTSPTSLTCGRFRVSSHRKRRHVVSTPSPASSKPQGHFESLLSKDEWSSLVSDVPETSFAPSHATKVDNFDIACEEIAPVASAPKVSASAQISPKISAEAAFSDLDASLLSPVPTVLSDTQQPPSQKPTSLEPTLHASLVAAAPVPAEKRKRGWTLPRSILPRKHTVESEFIITGDGRLQKDKSRKTKSDRPDSRKKKKESSKRKKKMKVMDEDVAVVTPPTPRIPSTKSRDSYLRQTWHGQNHGLNGLLDQTPPEPPPVPSGIRIVPFLNDRVSALGSRRRSKTVAHNGRPWSTLESPPPGCVFVNDDYLFPDALTPTKIPSFRSSADLIYNVPYMDDKALPPEEPEWPIGESKRTLLSQLSQNSDSLVRITAEEESSVISLDDGNQRKHKRDKSSRPSKHKKKGKRSSKTKSSKSEGTKRADPRSNSLRRFGTWLTKREESKAK